MKLRSAAFIILSISLIAGGWYARILYTRNFQQHIAEEITLNLAQELAVIDQEAKALQSDQLQITSGQWDKAKHFFVLADSTEVIAWNRNQYLPPLVTLQKLPAGTRNFVQTQRGQYLVMKWNELDRSALYCILPLTERFPIVNNFLSPTANPAIFPLPEMQLSAHFIEFGEEIVLDKTPLFRVLPGTPAFQESTLSFFLIAIGFVFFLIGIWELVRLLHNRINYDAAFVVLIGGLLALRIAMIAIGLPALFLQSDLFDPKKFASSSLNTSLGDLFLNALSLLFIVVYLFRNFRKFRFIHWLLERSGAVRWWGGTICLLACYFALLLAYNFVESIYHNSSISLDMQLLAFDSGRIMALVSILLGSVSSFLFIHVFFLTANHLFRSTPGFFAGCLLAAGLFIAQFYWAGQSLWPTLILGTIFFSTLRLTGIHSQEFKFSFRLFIYLIFSLFIFSVQNAWAVRIFYEERQVRDQFRFGKDFLIERDVLGEYLMDQMRQHIESDQFIQARMASPFLPKSAVEDKIRRVYLNNYFDRYEIGISSVGAESLEFGHQRTTDSLAAALKDFLPTGYSGIFYSKPGEGTGVKRYRITMPVYFHQPVGFIIMDFVLKRVIPNNVYPELLIDNRFKQLLTSRDFSYGVFDQNRLVSSFGQFNYDRDFPRDGLGNPDLFTRGIKGVGYYHVGIEDAYGALAIVSAPVFSWFYTIANFAFWFVMGLAVLFMGQGILGIVSFFRGEHFNYAARIQLFIFLAFFLPVLAVSITTMTLIGRSNEEAIKNDFLNRASVISQNIAPIFSTGPGKELTIEDWINENSISSQMDVSVYSAGGYLITSSQPALFENQLISSLIAREVFVKIILQGESSTVTNEQIGKLDYSCAYSAVLSPETGKLLAIVGIPFFESAAFLQKSQALIFSNILIVFVIVFILFSLLSFFAADSLTFPIRFIARTLGQTTLSGQNKPLKWDSPDEIGVLAKEYNRMVGNLEESKRALAQSEKESAWREMAKQVAHEIKNPLTPMKLTLQQMEQALKSGNLPVEKSEKSIDVLLKQVEILNEIAGSFSSFASMPSPSPQKIELRKFLQDVTDLFAAETTGSVSFLYPDDPATVLIDPTSFSRALSNIIINALQAGNNNQKLEVTISMVIQKPGVVISIRDNGNGMDQEVQARVFQPQFTTKKSGSGLGLAISRQTVIQAGGKIGFKSAVGEGTTFFVELPLAE